jgi:hypothetical protein
VHWFSDVCAGLLFGSFFLLGIEAVLDAVHRKDGCGLDRLDVRRNAQRGGAEDIGVAEGSTSSGG